MKHLFVFILLISFWPLTLLSQNNYTCESFNLRHKVKTIIAKYDSVRTTYHYREPEKLEFSIEGNLVYDSSEIVDEYTFYTIRNQPGTLQGIDMLFRGCDHETHDSLGNLIFKSTYEYKIDQNGEYEYFTARYYIYDQVGNLSEYRSYYKLDHEDVCKYDFKPLLNSKKPYETTYYNYEYDIKGNWTNRKSYRGVTLIDSISRIITYY